MGVWLACTADDGMLMDGRDEHKHNWLYELVSDHPPIPSPPRKKRKNTSGEEDWARSDETEFCLFIAYVFIIMGDNLRHNSFHFSYSVCGGVFRHQIKQTESYCLACNVCVCVVCVYLTDVDSSAVALHEHQHKDMQRDQVDDEDVASPC